MLRCISVYHIFSSTAEAEAEDDHGLALPGNEHLAPALHGGMYHALALPGNEHLAPALHRSMYHALALPGIIALALGLWQLVRQ